MGMLYSKTARYAVLALAEVARGAAGDAVPTKAIATRAEIPYALLAKIIRRLKEADLVVAKRGKNGGVCLARPASEMRVLDVVLALDGDGMLSECPLHLEPCLCEEECALHPIWKPVRDAVVRFLETTSIQDVSDARGDA
jgi:Rrf2 family iron-sulfur cluster assembly transcriptional regulator